MQRLVMDKSDARSESVEIPPRLRPLDIPKDVYEGIDLAPSTLDSLVTWDVSAHARREQDRMSSAYRPAEKTRGGY
jgi:hypothetical protein